MAAVRNLNIAFNQFYIYFKYRGFDVIDSSDFVDIRTEGDYLSPNLPTTAELNEYSMSQGYQVDNAINIFVVRQFFQVENGTETRLPGFYSSFYNNNVGLNMPNLILMRDYFTSGVLVHEMGHVFGGLHTNKSGVGLTPPTNSFCEHVTRTISTSPYDINYELTFGFNADSAGDLLIDTPASPSYYEDVDVDNNGIYIGNQRDCTGYQGYGLPYLPGVLYNTFTVPIKNYMNVNRIEDIQFQKEFSFQQGQVFRSTIDNINIQSMFNQISTTVQSLYEPFEEKLVAGSIIISTEDLGNGYVNVCRNRLQLHRFQEGFTYVFPENNGDPDLVNPSIYSIPFNVGHTSDYPIVINEIDPDYIGTVRLTCTRGLMCTEEEIVGGSDLITDALGSYNFSLENWDKLKAADPNFYYFLQSQKYHIIKKETKTGVIIQVVIYKP